jgi:hypothetical protein
MMKITIPPPPQNFQNRVSVPGEAFLKINPSPKASEWRRHSHWTQVHTELYESYHGICNYCSSWSPRSLEGVPQNNDWQTSIDHYKPKSKYPRDAYKWENFRLCRRRLNNLKKDYTDIIDPTEIENDWFWIDFTSFLLKPSPTLKDRDLYSKIFQTIKILRLNTDNDYINERKNVIAFYSLDIINKSYIQSKYPFMYYQMELQNFDEILKLRLKKHFQTIGNMIIDLRKIE